jgi:hypothetical protein
MSEDISTRLYERYSFLCDGGELKELIGDARDEIIRLRAQVADLTRLAGCAAVGKSFTDYKNETAEVRRKGLALLGLSEEPNHD